MTHDRSHDISPSPETDPGDFLGLFNAYTGEPIPASVDDLLLVEAQTIDTTVQQRVFGEAVRDTVGCTYAVLISDRVGFVAQATLIGVYGTQMDSRSYADGGIANHDGWSVDRLIESLNDHIQTRFGTYKNTPLSPTVESLIRAHVSYRPGIDPTDDPSRMGAFELTMIDADDVRRNLVAMSDVDPTGLVILASIGRVSMGELVIATSLYCIEAGLVGREDEVLERVLNPDQQERLLMQLGAAASAESDTRGTDLDDEIQKLLDE